MAEIIDLRQFAANDLEPLLRDETEEWIRELAWDFNANAALVRKYADMRALGGVAMFEDGEIVGYGYTVLEEHKALIGDLYVRPRWRMPGVEARLFRELLDQLMLLPQVRRVETQLILADAATANQVQRERFVRLYERILMSYDASLPLAKGRANQLHRFRIEPWGEHHRSAAAAMMVLAYDGHVDAQINEQYRTFEGAAEFLGNLLEFAGCGVFRPDASFAAVDLVTGWLAGMVLCSFVADDVAHITQVCVSPRARRTGLGYELLRLATEAAAHAGAKRVTLTVTAGNSTAAELYFGCGFEEMRRFYAYIWERY